jgi:hypothetical protein
MTVSSSRRPPLVPRWTLSTATPYILLTFVAIFAITLCFRLSPALGVIATLGFHRDGSVWLECAAAT